MIEIGPNLSSVIIAGFTVIVLIVFVWGITR